MGFGQILSDFANWSTVCGVPHIANAQTKLSRLFWLVIFVCMVGVFCYQLYTMIVKFLAYPVSVTTDIFFEEQRFPVVTVCNFNPYKYTVVQNNSNFAEIKKLMDTYTQSVHGTLTGPDSYGLYGVMSQSYDRDSRARDALVLAAAQLTEQQKEAALYTYNNLISECSFSGNPCDSSHFTKFIDPVYGACYSFNEDAALNFSSNRAGMRFGLKLLVTVSQETPKGVADFLPTTHLAGARVGINAPGAQPALESSGINVGVGYQTAVSLTLTKTRRAKRLYGRCVDTEPKATNYYQDKTYTLETCFNGCRQRETLDRCNCATPRYNKLDDDNYCIPTKGNLDCLQSLKGDQSNTGNPNLDPLTECDCDPPCDEITFLTTASLAKFPSEKYYVATDATQGAAPSCDHQTNPFNQNRDGCRRWYSNNALLLQVFFETLKFERYTELPSYGMSLDLLSFSPSLPLILSFVHPRQIVNCQLVSRQLYYAIKRNRHLMRRPTAKMEITVSNPLTIVGEPYPLKVLFIKENIIYKIGVSMYGINILHHSKSKGIGSMEQYFKENGILLDRPTELPMFFADNIAPIFLTTSYEQGIRLTLRYFFLKYHFSSIKCLSTKDLPDFPVWNDIIVDEFRLSRTKCQNFHLLLHPSPNMLCLFKKKMCGYPWIVAPREFGQFLDEIPSFDREMTIIVTPKTFQTFDSILDFLKSWEREKYPVVKSVRLYQRPNFGSFKWDSSHVIRTLSSFDCKKVKMEKRRRIADFYVTVFISRRMDGCLMAVRYSKKSRRLIMEEVRGYTGQDEQLRVKFKHPPGRHPLLHFW